MLVSDKFFSDSSHKSTIFSPAQINFLETNAYTKIIRGKPTFFIKCLVRGKEIRLTPEEAVRQMFIRKLIDDYGYNPAQMSVEYPIHFGRETKRADIVVFEPNNPTVEYIIVEVKKPKLKDGKEQLKSYCNATGVTMGIWSNGEKISFYHRKDPNYFEDIPDIPRAGQKLKDILRERRTIANLIADDKLLRENKTLADLIRELEDEVLAHAGVDVFEEVFKLIYTKLYDEMMSGRDKSRFLEFWNYGESNNQFKDTIQSLFDKAKQKWQGVFAEDDKIKLTPSQLAICVSSLQNVKLFNSNLDIIDDAFEYLMSKKKKGEKSQFFTPRYVIDMCVRMLNPKINETMIDTAAGSCGFPVHTMFYVWKNILKSKNLPQSHLFSLERKPIECENYVRRNIFAIDFDEDLVRIARTLNLIAGDGKTNVLHFNNTLDYERWNEIMDEDWREKYNEGWQKLRKLCTVKNDNSHFNFDILMANPPFSGEIKDSQIITKYELGKNNGKFQSKVKSVILFIERNLNFIKSGGRMAIILPQGILNNSSDKYIRDFIAERCRILAIVGLHGNVFKPHTGTKTSVLFVQKWDEKLCPRREDYPIFFATMREPSKDNSGEKIFEFKNGELLRDSHNHTIVKHDLFNHDGITRDGIAEAFIEFAKREGLSFFEQSSFDAAKYKILSEELECTEVFLSNEYFKIRWDSTFFLKADMNNFYLLSRLKCKTLSEISIVTDGEHGSPDWDENSNVKYITAEFIKPNEIIDLPMKTISYKQDKKNSRCRLKINDILFYSVGAYAGYACCAEPHIFPANIPRSVALIRLNNLSEFKAGFISVFLNCRYGFFQSIRLRAGNAQPVLAIENINCLRIPCFQVNFQQTIDKIYNLAYQNRMESKKNYHVAERMLSEALNLDNFKPSSENVAIKSLSASFGFSGRLDAEFYQSKHDDILKFLHSFEVTSINAEYDVLKNSGTDYADGVSDIGVIKTKQIKNNGIDIDGVESYFTEKTCTENKSNFLKFGDVIFASMGVGSLGKVSLFLYESEKKFVTDSTLRIYRAKRNSKVCPACLCLFLQSFIAQQLIYRYVVGSTGIINIYDEDMNKIPIPVLSREIQEKIAAQVSESFKLRSESEKLLLKAKKVVEIAIEQGEYAAIKFLEE